MGGLTVMTTMSRAQARVAAPTYTECRCSGSDTGRRRPRSSLLMAAISAATAPEGISSRIASSASTKHDQNGAGDTYFSQMMQPGV